MLRDSSFEWAWVHTNTSKNIPEHITKVWKEIIDFLKEKASLVYSPEKIKWNKVTFWYNELKHPEWKKINFILLVEN